MLRVGCADDDMSLTRLRVQQSLVMDRAEESCFTFGVLQILCSPPSTPAENPGGGGGGGGATL